MYSYDRRQAARPVRIDRATVDGVMDDFSGWVRSQGRRLGWDTPIETNPTDGFVTTVFLKTPWGEERQNFVAFVPKEHGSSIAGGQGWLYGSPVTKVFFDDRLHWRALESDVILSRLEAVLYHELTHALDHNKDTSSVEKDTHGYYNDPSEVRAYLRQIYEEIAPTVEWWMKTPKGPLWGLGKVILVSLQSQDTWRQMEPHLTSANRKRILKGLVTAFEDDFARA